MATSNFERLSAYINKSKTLNLQLGEFKIIKTLGQGGNGIVYEADFNDKPVAIKLLVSNATGNTLEQKQTRFLSEYFNIINVEHNSHIVKYIDYDVVQLNDTEEALAIPAIIMKKYDNSLKVFRSTPKEGDFLDLFDFLLDGIAQIHNQGVIHRDLKPENILVAGNDFYIGDFGIAAYNPDQFRVMAETEKKERLGNRLFSAPEQESPGTAPHPTMDIYAFGQVLQWYATGETHRGTGRKKITTVYDRLSIEDAIIEKCLQQDPTNRFQSITEINDFRDRASQPDVFDYLDAFNEICRQTYPKNPNGVVSFSDKNRIDLLFSNFQAHQSQFGSNLWWIDGTGGHLSLTSFKQIDKAVWKLGQYEYMVKKVWMYYDDGTTNDFVIMQYKKGKLFDYAGKKTNLSVIVDGIHSIDPSEWENGYAEIEGKVVDLSTRQVEYTTTRKKAGFLLICTRFTSIYQHQNQPVLRKFFKSILSKKTQPTENDIQELADQTRMEKHPEVLARL